MRQVAVREIQISLMGLGLPKRLPFPRNPGHGLPGDGSPAHEKSLCKVRARDQGQQEFSETLLVMRLPSHYMSQIAERQLSEEGDGPHLQVHIELAVERGRQLAGSTREIPSNNECNQTE